MRAGRIRHKVTVQRATDTANSMGEPIRSWATLATTWAGVEPTRGKEMYAAMQVQGEVVVRFILRYQSALSDLAINDRIMRGSTIYDIKSAVNIDERNIQFEIFAKQHI